MQLKKKNVFKNYHSSLSVFDYPDVKSLMNEMNRLKEEKEDWHALKTIVTRHIYKNV